MRRSGNIPASLTGLYRGAGAAAVVLGLFGGPAGAAQGPVPRIDSFGPYKLGMTLDQAKAAHKGGKPGACGDIAAGRQCIVLDAAVFEEPGVIYAVLDERVRWMIIGTHDAQLHGELIGMLFRHGWSLENEKPPRFRWRDGAPSLVSMGEVDGAQVWRNPRLVPNPS